MNERGEVCHQEHKGGTPTLGHVFSSKPVLSAGSQLMEHPEHVSRPSLAQGPAEALVMECSHLIAPIRILPLNPCSVCSTTSNAAPMAGVDANTG